MVPMTSPSILYFYARALADAFFLFKPMILGHNNQ